MGRDKKYIKVPISDLNTSDRSWKISRDIPQDGLEDSIKRYGILDPPVVIKKGAGYGLVSGFNRVDIGFNSGIENIDVVSCADFGAEDFSRIFFLKVCRNEVGPAGRLKAVNLMIERFGVDSISMLRETPSLWGVPEGFVFDPDRVRKLKSLSKNLLDYVDSKNVAYKYMKMLSDLPPDISGRIGEWAFFLSMRVNIFRQIVEMIYEAAAREKSNDFFYGIDPDLSGGKREAEDYLFNSVFRLRYPDLSSVIEKASGLTEIISSAGVDVGFPEMVERDYVSLTLRLGRNSNIEARLKAVIRFEKEIKELLSLL